MNITLPIDIEDKFLVPINYSLKTKLKWFAGLSDADGSIAINSGNQSLQIGSIHKEFLLKIKLFKPDEKLFELLFKPNLNLSKIPIIKY